VEVTDNIGGKSRQNHSILEMDLPARRDDARGHVGTCMCSRGPDSVTYWCSLETVCVCVQLFRAEYRVRPPAPPCTRGGGRTEYEYTVWSMYLSGNSRTAVEAPPTTRVGGVLTRVGGGPTRVSGDRRDNIIF
jgi:hypothetical protein